MMTDKESIRRLAPRTEPWSESDILTLIRLCEAAMPMESIAAEMGRTRQSVSVKACRLGLTKRACHNARRKRSARIRRCLCCNQFFRSEGFGNRVCAACKCNDGWRTGGDWSDIQP